MRHVETLKDGKKVVLKELSLNDLDRLMKFYCALPPEDRKYLRVDVTDRKVVEQRIKTSKKDNIYRIIALQGEDIVGDGALELSPESWRRNQGELRVIVSNKHRHKGLGLIMMRELHFIALKRNVEKVIAKMMRPQVGAVRICRKLGFHQEAVIPDYVVDQAGKTQDLIIMTAEIKDFWHELEHVYDDSDWQRCR